LLSECLIRCKTCAQPREEYAHDAHLCVFGRRLPFLFCSVDGRGYRSGAGIPWSQCAVWRRYPRIGLVAYLSVEPVQLWAQSLQPHYPALSVSLSGAIPLSLIYALELFVVRTAALGWTRRRAGSPRAGNASGDSSSKWRNAYAAARRRGYPSAPARSI